MVSKTGEERKIPVLPNLKAWLAPQAQATGHLLPRKHSQWVDLLVSELAHFPPRELREGGFARNICDPGQRRASSVVLGEVL